MKIKSAYFLIADHVKHYDDAMIYIAEGLRVLGIPFYANKNLWLEEPGTNQYLFKKDDQISYQDCDIVFMSYTWFEYVDHINYKTFSQLPPKDFFDTKRKYITVYLDPTDGYKTKSWDSYFRNFDLILRAKYNSKTYNHANVKPWVLGFTNRIIKATQNQLVPQERERVFLQNYNFSHPYEHGLRTLAKNTINKHLNKRIEIKETITDKETADFSEYDLLMWQQTGGKHHPKYYNMLCKSLGNLCFCGELIPGLPNDPSIFLKGGNKAKLNKIIFEYLSNLLNKKERIIQWDSWRFWETLCAGSIAIHIDIEQYGAELPVMPKNHVTYIGFDLSNLKKSVNQIFEDEEALFKIALNGKKWALENYSPKISSQRLLSLI